MKKAYIFTAILFAVSVTLSSAQVKVKKSQDNFQKEQIVSKDNPRKVALTQIKQDIGSESIKNNLTENQFSALMKKKYDAQLKAQKAYILKNSNKTPEVDTKADGTIKM